MKALFLLIFVAIFYFEAKGEEESQGRVSYIENIVKKRTTVDTTWTDTQEGARVITGDKVRTYVQSRAEVNLEGLSVIRLAPKTTIDIERLYEESLDERTKTTLNIEEGEIWSNTNKLSDDLDFEINTDVAGMAIKGTVFRVAMQENGNTRLKVYSGKVEIGNVVSSQTGQAPGSVDQRRFKVDKPSRVSGPRKVSIKEWVEIVTNMQEIEISKDGLLLFKRNFDLSSPEEQTDWVKWNKDRDKLLEK